MTFCDACFKFPCTDCEVYKKKHPELFKPQQEKSEHEKETI